MGNENYAKLTEAEREVIKKTGKLLNEMEKSIEQFGADILPDDFRMFKKHFRNITNGKLFDGSYSSEDSKKSYAQSAKWLDDFMNNPVKAASLKNFFSDYKGGVGADDLEASLFVIDSTLGLEYNYDAIDEMQPKLRNDPKLLQKSGTILEGNFKADETFGHDKWVNKILDEKAKIKADQEKRANADHTFTREKKPAPAKKEPDFSNEKENYSYDNASMRYDSLSNEEKRYFFDLLQGIAQVEAKLQKSGKKDELEQMKDFHKHFYGLTNNSVYHGITMSSEKAHKVFEESKAGMKSYMDDPKKLAGIMKILKTHGDENAFDKLDASMFFVSQTFGLEYDFDAANELSEKPFSELMSSPAHAKKEAPKTEEKVVKNKIKLDSMEKPAPKSEEKVVKNKIKLDSMEKPAPNKSNENKKEQRKLYSIEHAEHFHDNYTQQEKDAIMDTDELLAFISQEERLNGDKKLGKLVENLVHCLHGTMINIEKDKYEKAAQGLQEIMGDPKKLAVIYDTVEAYAARQKNKDYVNQFEHCLFIAENATNVKQNVKEVKALRSELRSEREKKRIKSEWEVIDDISEAPSAEGEDELKRSGHAAEPVELTVKRLAPALKTRHRVSFIGGGQSAVMQEVQKDVDTFLEYCKNPNDPQFAKVNEEKLLENLKKSAEAYIADKKKGRWSNTDDPNWRPNTEMGKKRYEAVLGILDSVNTRLDQIGLNTQMASYKSPVKPTPVKKTEGKTVVENNLANEELKTNAASNQTILKEKADNVKTNVKPEAEEMNIDVDATQVGEDKSTEKVDINALYEGKQNVFDMAKQDVKTGSIVRYQNNIRTILNQGKPKDIDKMKNELGKEYAGIIATKSVWKKPSEPIGDVYKNKGSKEYTEQKKVLDADKKQRDTIQNYLVEKDKGFNRMMAGVKDWKSVVDTSMKALTPNASEMLRDYMMNKNLVTETKKTKTIDSPKPNLTKNI